MVGPQEAKNTAVLPVCDKNLICVLSRILLCFESNSKDCRTGSQGVVMFFIFYLLFFFHFFCKKIRRGWAWCGLLARWSAASRARGEAARTQCAQRQHTVCTQTAPCVLCIAAHSLLGAHSA